MKANNIVSFDIMWRASAMYLPASQVFRQKVIPYYQKFIQPDLESLGFQGEEFLELLYELEAEFTPEILLSKDQQEELLGVVTDTSIELFNSDEIEQLMICRKALEHFVYSCSILK